MKQKEIIALAEEFGAEYHCIYGEDSPIIFHSIEELESFIDYYKNKPLATKINIKSEPVDYYQYEIMDRTHIICELIESALLNNVGIKKEQIKMVETALEALGNLYQDAGAKSYNDIQLSTKSPTTALQEHDNALIEKCAMLLEGGNFLTNTSMEYKFAYQASKAIRELKND